MLSSLLFHADNNIVVESYGWQTIIQRPISWSKIALFEWHNYRQMFAVSKQRANSAIFSNLIRSTSGAGGTGRRLVSNSPYMYLLARFSQIADCVTLKTHKWHEKQKLSSSLFQILEILGDMSGSSTPESPSMHVRSHTVTFHPTQVNTPHLNPSRISQYST